MGMKLFKLDDTGVLDTRLMGTSETSGTSGTRPLNGGGQWARNRGFGDQLHVARSAAASLTMLGKQAICRHACIH